MGYEGPTEVYMFFKSKFSPQWRFFVHTLQHCISRKTTGWSEFSSTLAYALVCLATSRKFNFSQMIFNDLMSNLDTKTKSFYMYPRFVQEILLKELTDLPSFEKVYVPKPPKGKVFSNMKRPSKDFSGPETPLFSTMMVMSHSHGEASASKPTSDNPTDDLPTPFISIDTPQIPIVKPISPITKTYKRKKVQKVPSLPVSSPQLPASPLMEHSPLENIKRETTGVSPNPKKVLSKEKEEHVGSKAHTTDFAQGAGQDSVNISKTFPTTTLDEQSSKGPRCQETTGVADVHNQGLEIKEMKKLITSQQVQIAKLKKMVIRLMHKKKKTKFVLKKRSIDHDASKKGETQEKECEKQSPVGMESHFEGELNSKAEKKQAAETAKAVATEKEVETTSTTETFVKAAEIGKAAVTESAAETEQEVVTAAAETELSREEIEIAETLVKAKLDTPKATPKAKGVVIKEVEKEKKRKEFSVAEAKKKGKEKMIEPEKPSKKQTQIELDEEMAKKLQEELEKEEEVQSAKDRELALEMAKTINEEYQRRLKTVVASKKVTLRATRQSQRKPSKTFLENQERRKMINFLKGAIGVPEGMFTKADVQSQEQRPEQTSQQYSDQHSRSDDQVNLYMTVTNEEPMQADPISMKAPEIIHWDTLKDNRREYFRIKRMGDQFEVYSSWGKVIRSCSRADLEEMYKVGIKLYENVLKGTEMNLTKISMEYLCMMFEPERVQHRIKDLHHEYEFKEIDYWMLFENCGVYVITIDKRYHEYYLVEKVYDHSKAKLQGMLNAKLVCPTVTTASMVSTAEEINIAMEINAACEDKDDLKRKTRS
ncbi:hypothetical protein L6452_14971 [Arctium lappa]|uniref:Uncharacterized protein n=1 Tax=Arctium lappa TaxID=4217 RepID=A0ACB9CME8_ARCLA|nr:hypothetical protein L6452_14971 [Arctium lappa]